jgi:ribonuclease R
MENEYALVGRGTGLRFQMGDAIRIKVTAASLEKRQLDYTLAESPQNTRNRSRRKPEPEWDRPSAPKGRGGKAKPKGSGAKSSGSKVKGKR